MSDLSRHGNPMATEGVATRFAIGNDYHALALEHAVEFCYMTSVRSTATIVYVLKEAGYSFLEFYHLRR